MARTITPEIIKGPGGRPTDYRPEFAEQAFKLCLLGATDEDLGSFFDKPVSTINNWKIAFPEFLESLNAGKDKADAEVAHKLYRRATGYSHKVKKVFAHKVRQGYGNGDFEEEVKVTEVEVEEHFAPDVTACTFWLGSRRRTRQTDTASTPRWSQKVEQANTFPEGIPTPMHDEQARTTRERMLAELTPLPVDQQGEPAA